MTDRFKYLNIGSSQKKSNSKVNNNSQRENIFKSGEGKSSNDQKQRSTTGKSLKELVEESSNRGSGRYNSYRHKERGAGGGGNRHGKGKMFTRTNIVNTQKIKEEFNIEEIEFPELVAPVEKSEIIENIYKDKVNIIPEKNLEKQEVTLPKGWVNLKLVKSSPKVDNDNKELDISPYYNPKLAKKILEDRYRYREELNELLGDISPYWNMMYPEDLEDSDENYDIDEVSEEEEEYVEDW